ncbi:uncharacterized protein LOC123300771 [Chrysoperla carnea]|uniref:uncharacterized protein LOC123300771 n=1 Tax=Chrysoperla carnea TaxID=189513 RepID=UPI001D07BFC1|nr:uncharacterized protein LOC123300771 [Chrysoperla carnea]
MIFVKQNLVFLLIAVSIQSALSYDCPIVCPDTYAPICGLNQVGRIKRIFPNKCLLNVANCLNGKYYDDVQWKPCTLGQLITGSSIEFHFGSNADDGTDFNFNGNDNENGANNQNEVKNTPRQLLTDNKIVFGFGDNSTDGTDFNFNGNDNENGENNKNDVENTSSKY